MKHASDSSLDQIESLLEELRKLPGLKEKKRGVFYRGSQAFAHFHEDAEGMFGDLKVDGSWKRFCVSRQSESKQFIADASAETKTKG